MSCYVVTEPTIHAIVRGGLQYGLVRRASADLIGAALLYANYSSMAYRYGDAMPASINYRLPVGVPKLKPTAIYGCLRCFQYQACEAEGWNDSAAREFTAELMTRIERRHPEYRTDRVGQPWGIATYEHLLGWAL